MVKDGEDWNILQKKEIDNLKLGLLRCPNCDAVHIMYLLESPRLDS